MACITKLAGGFAYDCDTGITGLVNAIIINKEDIISFTVESGLVTNISLGSGASVYKIDTPKRVLTIADSLKVNEGAPNALSFSASVTLTSVISSDVRTKIINSLLNGSYVIITKEQSEVYRVYGLYYGLSSSTFDRSTADNGGWVTVTLSTPEQVLGEDWLQMTPGGYNTLYTAAVY